jgi:hypothetical protein
MEEGWTRIHSTNDEFHADMLKQMLDDHEVPVALINKKDSNAFLIGEIEVYVPIGFSVRAIQLINEFELE